MMANETGSTYLAAAAAGWLCWGGMVVEFGGGGGEVGQVRIELTFGF